jgi:hypothetical protein
LIVTGDAVCAFNPIYGQGMTVSAMDATTLQRCLQEQQLSPRADFEQHFQYQLAKITGPAWLLATNQDLRWSKVRLRGARPNPGVRLLHRYLDIVLSNAVVDPKLANAYFNVLILAAPPSSLVRPRVVVHVLTIALKRAAKRLLGRREDPIFALSSEALTNLCARPGGKNQFHS